MVPYSIETAEVVLPCRELDATLQFFTDQLGLHVTSIFPADDPAVAVLVGHGVRIRLERGRTGDPGVLRLRCRGLRPGTPALIAPNGTHIELVDADPTLTLPTLRASLMVTHLDDDAQWVQGRAGMRYRDLIPGRQGGFLIASHIQIPDGGPVADYVHFHKVHFQMIYCYRGWVRVVYEDQGPPFVLQAGDCVLQPPQIRHRVLESSPGLEVIEIGCPAEHETHADADMSLPNGPAVPDRRFGEQTFLRHVEREAQWRPWRLPGFESRSIGMGRATGGVAGVHVARSREQQGSGDLRHQAELMFLFVLEGSVTLGCEGHEPAAMGAGSACVIPAGLTHSLRDASPDLQVLEVAFPARFETVRV